MAKLGIPDDIEQTDLKYPAEDGTLLRAKLHRSARMSTEGSHPLIILYHGGGFVTGGPESEEITCRNFTRSLWRHLPLYRVPPRPGIQIPPRRQRRLGVFEMGSSSRRILGCRPCSWL